MAEALHGTFKAELIEMQGPWTGFDQVERAIFQWVTWYNEERLHSALDYVPPAEYERDVRRSQEPVPQSAWNKITGLYERGAAHPGVTRRKRRSLNRPDAKAKPAPDLIGRDFQAERPRTRLVCDITCLPTAEGWLYLACWPDLATREVVGYAMADHHRAELVVVALDMAHGRDGLEPGCVVRSGRGSEYTSTSSVTP